MRARVTVYMDRRGTWRWKFTVNGRTMAASGEGYTRRRQAWRAWDHFLDYFLEDPVGRRAAETTRYSEWSTDPKHSPKKLRSAQPGRGVDAY